MPQVKCNEAVLTGGKNGGQFHWAGCYFFIPQRTLHYCLRLEPQQVLSSGAVGAFEKL